VQSNEPVEIRHSRLMAQVRTGVPAAKWMVESKVPTTWPDSDLGLPSSGEHVYPGPIRGTRIALSHGSKRVIIHMGTVPHPYYPWRQARFAGEEIRITGSRLAL